MPTDIQQQYRYVDTISYRRSAVNVATTDKQLSATNILMSMGSDPGVLLKCQCKQNRAEQRHNADHDDIA